MKRLQIFLVAKCIVYVLIDKVDKQYELSTTSCFFTCWFLYSMNHSTISIILKSENIMKHVKSSMTMQFAIINVRQRKLWKSLTSC